jgi:Tfp pilus assembly protein PilO
VVVSIFAILKVSGATAEIPLWLNIARIFFILSHLFMAVVFIRTTLKVENNVGTAESKSQRRNSLRKSFGNIILRAIIIAAIHWKTQMLQPLFVSSTLGLFTVAEIDDLLLNENMNRKS